MMKSTLLKNRDPPSLGLAYTDLSSAHIAPLNLTQSVTPSRRSYHQSTLARRSRSPPPHQAHRTRSMAIAAAR